MAQGMWSGVEVVYEADHEWRAEHEPMAEAESEGARVGAGDPKPKPLIIGEPGIDWAGEDVLMGELSETDEGWRAIL